MQDLQVYLQCVQIDPECFSISDVSANGRYLYSIAANDNETTQYVLQQVARPATNPVVMNKVSVLTSVVQVSGNLITVEIKFLE